MKKGILFLCTGNSCRSQIAEGFAKAFAPEGVKIYSAGLEPAGLNPYAVKVMAEVGIDISGQYSKSIDEIPAHEIDTVITLCGDAEERCPSFPGNVKRIHWPLPDPAKATGSQEQITRVFRSVRDEIKRRVEEFFSLNY